MAMSARLLRGRAPHILGRQRLHRGPPRANGAAVYCPPFRSTRAFPHPPSRVKGATIAALLRRHPLAASVAIATAKTSLADLFVQTMAEGRSWREINWERNVVFTAFGFGYLGFALYGMKVKGFQRLFPGLEAFCNKSLSAKLRDRAGLRTMLSQVALDVGVLNPLVYWPSFYGFKALCFRDPSDSRSVLAMLRETLLVQYPATAADDNLGMAKFWIPMNLVIYSVPLFLRMPLNHTASLLWCCILSLAQGKAIEATDLLPAAPAGHPVATSGIGVAANAAAAERANSTSDGAGRHPHMDLLGLRSRSPASTLLTTRGNEEHWEDNWG